MTRIYNESYLHVTIYTYFILFNTFIKSNDSYLHFLLLLFLLLLPVTSLSNISPEIKEYTCKWILKVHTVNEDIRVHESMDKFLECSWISHIRGFLSHIHFVSLVSFSESTWGKYLLKIFFTDTQARQSFTVHPLIWRENLLKFEPSRKTLSFWNDLWVRYVIRKKKNKL